MNTIEKRTVLKASQERVWKALTDSEEFGKWFGMRLDGPFQAGQRITGEIRKTTVDEEVARHQAPYEGKKVEFTIEKIEPQSLFSMRWHPYAIDENVDYSSEPTTLIEFTLQDTPEGVLLTVTESGFDQIPLERRAQAFQANEGGWAKQMELIAKYLAQNGS